MPIPFLPLPEPLFGIGHGLQQRFLSCKLSLRSFYLPFLCGGISWTRASCPSPIPSLWWWIIMMTDHQVIRTLSIWNCVSSLMDQFLSAWPSTERGMCFSPYYPTKNPRPLPGMSGRKKKKGMTGVLMLWATPVAFPLSTGGFLDGYLVMGVTEKSKGVGIRRCGFESWFKALLLCIYYRFPKLSEPQSSQFWNGENALFLTGFLENHN